MKKLFFTAITLFAFMLSCRQSFTLKSTGLGQQFTNEFILGDFAAMYRSVPFITQQTTS